MAPQKLLLELFFVKYVKVILLFTSIQSKIKNLSRKRDTLNRNERIQIKYSLDYSK